MKTGIAGHPSKIVREFYYKYCLVLLILKKYDIIQTASGNNNDNIIKIL